MRRAASSVPLARTPSSEPTHLEVDDLGEEVPLKLQGELRQLVDPHLQGGGDTRCSIGDRRQHERSRKTRAARVAGRPHLRRVDACHSQESAVGGHLGPLGGARELELLQAGVGARVRADFSWLMGVTWPKQMSAAAQEACGGVQLLSATGGSTAATRHPFPSLPHAIECETASAAAGRLSNARLASTREAHR